MDNKVPTEIAVLLIAFFDAYGASSYSEASSEDIFNAYKAKRSDKHRFYDKHVKRFLEDLEEF